MRQFMDDSFLLFGKTPEKLYHEFAEKMPIFDYHCHLSPKEIAEDKKYENITEVWLKGDHYKWRAMRSNGIQEKYITGNASDKDKFVKWAETMPFLIGNPLYHWTHLELKRYFGIDELLGPDTADDIWERCNEMLKQDDFSARSLIKSSNVRGLCTTDDPIDSLEYHIKIAKDESFKVKVLPAFRPDKSFAIEDEGFGRYIEKLGKAAGIKIKSFSDLCSALVQRINYFHKAGCRVSDHGLEPVVYMRGTKEEADKTFMKALKGEKLTEDEVKKFKTSVLIFLGRQYAKYGWTMQYHIGTMRSNSTRMMRALGPNTGFDAIGDYTYAHSLLKLLDALDITNELPKTILYCVNPGDNYMIASIIGCFQSSEVPGKVQFGSGWWFNDQKNGMEEQMIALANLGLLSRFVGMLTDSRSFLSYTRHEYFRRILCNLLGQWVDRGEVPYDMVLMGNMVKDICFNNAKNYFGIEL